MRTNSESGNILIYVLGALFLMGLLIVMVKGSSTPGSNIDSEALAIKVSEVRQYGDELERAVTFIMQNGYSENDIRFAHASAHADYSAAGNIDNIPGRQVFNKTGGGATFRDPPGGIQTTATPWAFSGAAMVSGIGTTCAQSSCADLTAFLMYVSKNFCLSLNKQAGVANPSGDAPVDTDGFSWTAKFTGSYGAASAVDTTGNHTLSRKEGCVKNGTDYHYYRVLLAR